MRVISSTRVRQDASRVIREAQDSDEPTLVVLRSAPAAYIVGAAQYKALLDELRWLRRELFAYRVEEGEAEARANPLPVYSSAEEMMDAIERGLGE
jgi:prevent-host-death family protein